MNERPIEISVVAPIYCEAATLPELHRRTTAALEAEGVSFEIVLVNDGSTDESPRILDELVEKDPRVRVVHLSRNFGLQPAVTAGLDHARGRAVILMDGDLQDPPELFGELIARWREGYEVVQTTKITRQEGGLRGAAFRGFYGLYNRLADTRIPAGSGLFSLMDRRVVDVLTTFREQHRFVSGLRTWVGFRQCEVPFHREARADGEPRQSLSNLFQLAFDAMFSFSTLPLRLATLAGVIISALSFAAVVVIIAVRILSELAIPGWASVLSAIFLMGGLQLLFFGVLGEYVGRIYAEVKARPYYVVDRVVERER